MEIGGRVTPLLLLGGGAGGGRVYGPLYELPLAPACDPGAPE